MGFTPRAEPPSFNTSGKMCDQTGSLKAPTVMITQTVQAVSGAISLRRLRDRDSGDSPNEWRLFRWLIIQAAEMDPNDYDVRVGPLRRFTGNYTSSSQSKLSSAQEAAEQVSGFEDGAEGHEEDWYDGDTMKCGTGSLTENTQSVYRSRSWVTQASHR